jgi:hypothetical protein
LPGIVEGFKKLFGMGEAAPGQTTAGNPREPTEDEKKEVGAWFDRIKRAEDRPERKAWVKSCDELRKAVKGIRNGKQVRENLVLSTLNVILPRIYARQPTIVCRPAERVSAHEYPWLQDFAKTLSLLVNQQLRRAAIKQRGKAWVRAAMTVSMGWLKATYQRDYDSDPETTNRIADTQDNLARVERLVAELAAEDAETGDELTLKQAELKRQLEALQEDLEVKVSQGLVLDRIDHGDLIGDDS